MTGIEKLLVGRMLNDRYRIEEVIGRGGMGAVYRAVDERLGRPVALKVITAVSGTGDADARDRLRARFFREARSAAALPHHPNVVPVYDYGSDEELGLDFLVMELLRGSDLATRLARSDLPALPAALKILLEAARGVAVGHRQGLIHRDIKPGNIFLTEPDPNEVQVRVVDFGIAKLADDEDTLAQLTQDGRAPHSPAYASPEQLRGLQSLTPASDVFSLGAVGFQLLTGQRPFTESDRNRMSLGMPVDVPSVKALNPAIPSAVDAVIRKALDFDAEQRFANAGAMASAIEKAMRSLGDLTVDPFLAGSAIVTASEDVPDETLLDAEDEDDRTQLMEPEGVPFDEDDRTLLAPPSVAEEPARAVEPEEPILEPVAAAPRRERTPKRDVPPPRISPRRATRSRGPGRLAWAVLAAAVAGGGVWAYTEMADNQTAIEIPPAPDSIEVITPAPTVELEPQPTELDAYLNNQEGIRYFQAGRYDSAAVQFGRAVEVVPDNADYRRNFGLALLQLGALDDAEEMLDRAVELAPERAEPYESRSRVELAQGDTTGAIQSLQRYLVLESRPAQRAVAERRLRELEAARQSNLPELLGERIEPDPVTEDSLAAPTAVPRPGAGNPGD